MNDWDLSYLKEINKKIAFKKTSGDIKLRGLIMFLPKDTVMIDDKNKTIFTPDEWEKFVKSRFSNNVYNVKKTFNAKIVDFK